MAFVGATNAGTLLAEPDNWKTFIDLYTNLAASVARSAGFATEAVPAAAILGGLVSGIGAFVMFLVTASITDHGIPGLAAMEPDGPFITGINGTQPGQPAAGTVPNIPLIEREPQALGRLLRSLHVVTNGADFMNLALHVQIHCQVTRGAGAR